MTNKFIKRRPYSVVVFLVVLSMSLFLFTACEKEMEKPKAPTGFAEAQTCVGCHTNVELLKAYATPEPPPPPSGEG